MFTYKNTLFGRDGNQFPFEIDFLAYKNHQTKKARLIPESYIIVL